MTEAPDDAAAPAAEAGSVAGSSAEAEKAAAVKAFLAERKTARDAADVGTAATEAEDPKTEAPEEPKDPEPEPLVVGDRVEYLAAGAPADEGRNAEVVTVDDDWTPAKVTIKFEDSGGKKTVRGFGQLTKVAAAVVKPPYSEAEHLERFSRATFARTDAIQVPPPPLPPSPR